MLPQSSLILFVGLILSEFAGPYVLLRGSDFYIGSNAADMQVSSVFAIAVLFLITVCGLLKYFSTATSFTLLSFVELIGITFSNVCSSNPLCRLIRVLKLVLIPFQIRFFSPTVSAIFWTASQAISLFSALADPPYESIRHIQIAFYGCSFGLLSQTNLLMTLILTSVSYVFIGEMLFVVVFVLCEFIHRPDPIIEEVLRRQMQSINFSDISFLRQRETSKIPLLECIRSAITNQFRWSKNFELYLLKAIEGLSSSEGFSEQNFLKILKRLVAQQGEGISFSEAEFAIYHLSKGSVSQKQQAIGIFYSQSIRLEGANILQRWILQVLRKNIFSRLPKNPSDCQAVRFHKANENFTEAHNLLKQLSNCDFAFYRSLSSRSQTLEHYSAVLERRYDLKKVLQRLIFQQARFYNSMNLKRLQLLFQALNVNARARWSSFFKSSQSPIGSEIIANRPMEAFEMTESWGIIVCDGFGRGSLITADMRTMQTMFPQGVNFKRGKITIQDLLPSATQQQQHLKLFQQTSVSYLPNKINRTETNIISSLAKHNLFDCLLQHRKRFTVNGQTYDIAFLTRHRIGLRVYRELTHSYRWVCTLTDPGAELLITEAEWKNHISILLTLYNKVPIDLHTQLGERMHLNMLLQRNPLYEGTASNTAAGLGAQLESNKFKVIEKGIALGINQYRGFFLCYLAFILVSILLSLSMLSAISVFRHEEIGIMDEITNLAQLGINRTYLYQKQLVTFTLTKKIVELNPSLSGVCKSIGIPDLKAYSQSKLKQIGLNRNLQSFVTQASSSLLSLLLQPNVNMNITSFSLLSYSAEIKELAILVNSKSIDNEDMDVIVRQFPSFGDLDSPANLYFLSMGLSEQILKQKTQQNQFLIFFSVILVALVPLVCLLVGFLVTLFTEQDYLRAMLQLGNQFYPMKIQVLKIVLSNLNEIQKNIFRPTDNIQSRGGSCSEGHTKTFTGYGETDPIRSPEESKGLTGILAGMLHGKSKTKSKNDRNEDRASSKSGSHVSFAAFNSLATSLEDKEWTIFSSLKASFPTFKKVAMAGLLWCSVMCGIILVYLSSTITEIEKLNSFQQLLGVVARVQEAAAKSVLIEWGNLSNYSDYFTANVTELIDKIDLSEFQLLNQLLYFSQIEAFFYSPLTNNVTDELTRVLSEGFTPTMAMFVRNMAAISSMTKNLADSVYTETLCKNTVIVWDYTADAASNVLASFRSAIIRDSSVQAASLEVLLYILLLVFTLLSARIMFLTWAHLVKPQEEVLSLAHPQRLYVCEAYRPFLNRLYYEP